MLQLLIVCDKALRLRIVAVRELQSNIIGLCHLVFADRRFFTRDVPGNQASARLTHLWFADGGGEGPRG